MGSGAVKVGRSGSEAIRDRLHGLYVITDTTAQRGPDLVDVVRQGIEGGARVVQYRDKSGDAELRFSEAQALRSLTAELGVVLLINDDVALAQRVAADGVHLGRDDQALLAAREALGSEAIIGASCYNRIDLAERAIAQSADYCAFGAVFPSSTKPEAAAASLALLNEARARLPVPICAIGGINADNAASVIAAGADMLAVISAVFAARDIQAAANRIARQFEEDFPD